MTKLTDDDNERLWTTIGRGDEDDSEADERFLTSPSGKGRKMERKRGREEEEEEDDVKEDDDLKEEEDDVKDIFREYLQ